MMRQTGGVAVAAISTRSSPLPRAMVSACCGGMMPSCCPVSSMTRTSRTLMRSFTRVRSSRRGLRSKAITTSLLPFPAGLEQRRFDEDIERPAALIAFAPAAHGDSAFGGFPIPGYQHIGDLLELRLADLISNLFLPLVRLDPQPRRLELVPHTAG